MNLTPHPLHTALFDLDGTLIEVSLNFPQMKEAVLVIAREYGVYEARLEGLDILGAVETCAAALEMGGSRVQFQEASERALVAFEVDASHGARAVPGAERVLEELRRRRVRTAIVTRNCRAAVENALRRVLLPVDVILTRNDVPRAKPDPGHLHAALNLLQRDASGAVMVGDHWMDVQAGRAARTLTAGLLTSGRGRDWFSPCPPDYILENLEELLELF